MIWNIAAFLVAIAILIAVHEFGHFWVARRCGVKVTRFSIGFGPKLFEFKDKMNTEFCLSAIPLGGYVKMLNAAEENVEEELLPYTFDHQPLLKKVAIVSAGPIANFIFALFAYWLVFMIGLTTLKPIIGNVLPDSPAAHAGFKTEMELKTVGGTPVSNWMDVSMQIISNSGERYIPIEVLNSNSSNQLSQLTLNLEGWIFDPDGKDNSIAGLQSVSPKVYTQLSAVEPGSAADTAGLLVGDTIVAIDEQPIQTWDEIAERIQKHPNQQLSFKVSRAGTVQTILLTPTAKTDKEGKKRGLAGISPKVDPIAERYQTKSQFTPFAAMKAALKKTNETIALTLKIIKKLFTRDIGIDNLSGPISIAQGAGATAGQGITPFLLFLAMISINLGILNLVPLPILDGGHILFFTIESIIKRPIPEKIMTISYKFSGIILLALMIVALTNDIMRL